MQVLGFDFGTSVIGVASGQTLTCTAMPVALLRARDGIPQWHEIERLVAEWQPEAFVVGVPLNMDGSDAVYAPHARKFGQRLSARFNRPWFPADERLSTREAWSIVADTRPSTRHRQRVDDVAAVLLLEAWLRQQSPA